ncbi:hypothetical protein CkaCkLH20_10116 [Colletotrichum karsti]|uniref:Heterokaryon incompatibility domain-containing protein n=1 Tax=Colletotrichum karsti TaxID=1095194 RepID=A0A9P6HXM4_9PEZI|nr:uncharacterized protein CkaCkLH20_10116 [Colletotrichum karsti]KAF9872289.1 hypothetical protein CkaCkLH20_10116 [Colletotrichum karsti]
MDPYRYKALHPGEIRLLRLHPAPDPDQDLTGSIVHHKLSNPTYCEHPDGPYLQHDLAYEAVSYHWGSNTKTPFKLLVRDEGADVDSPATIVPLTAALHTLLRQLAYSDNDRVVWVDAICINQVLSTTNVEKGEQIRLMPDIYRIASRVLVYLGPAADNSDLAIDFLQEISKYYKYLDELLPSASFEAALAAGFVMPPKNAPEWAALRAFWRRAWFRRVWVIQEFVNATEIVVLCGPREVDWRKLFLAASAYVDNIRLAHNGYQSNWLVPLRQLPWYQNWRLGQWREAHEGARSMFTIADFRLRRDGYMSPAYMYINMTERDENDRWEQPIPFKKGFEAICYFQRLVRPRMLQDRADGIAFPHGKKGMLELLLTTENFLATHPVDRIYALLGMAGDVDGDDFAPIYSKEQTVATVSKRFALGLLKRGQGAQVLSRSGLRPKTTAGNDESQDERPSWVPNWTDVVYAQDKWSGFTMLVGDRSEDGAGSGADATATAASPTAETASSPTNGEGAPKKDDKFRMYTASGDTDFSYRLDERQNVLYVKGIAVDVVAAIIPGKLLMGTFMQDFLIKSTFKHTGKGYPTGEPIDEVIWRTHIANRTLMGEMPDEKHRDLYEIVKARDYQMFQFATFIAVAACIIATPLVLVIVRRVPFYFESAILGALWHKEYLPLRAAGVLLFLAPLLKNLHWVYAIPLLLYMAYLGATQVWATGVLLLVSKLGVVSSAVPGLLPPECMLYTDAMARFMNKCNLAVTNAGLVGLLPLATQVGDAIAIVHGCDAPFVLRIGENGLWRVVGECYVHGIMDGALADSAAEEVGLY